MEEPLVLLVDDDGEVRRLLAAVLTPRGYRVQEAHDGRDAIDKIHIEVPRLIVLDYWMPVLDGPGFMLELHQLLSRRPPVILFTAVHDDPQLARRLGVDVYVEKPVDLHRFLKLVDATVRGASLALVAPTREDGRERRTRPRVDYRHAVEVRVPNRPGTSAAFTVDVSEAGMCVELTADLPAVIGGYLAVVITDEYGERVELDARVRYRGDRRVGVQFFALDKPRRAALEAFLAHAGL